MQQLASGKSLKKRDAEGLFELIMQGELTESQITAILMAMAVRGETVDEITGAAKAIRAKTTPFPDHNISAVDCCGTGGDGKNTYNISTTTAIVAAACGVPVAKHGNRAVSSNSGSADILTELGVAIDAEPEKSLKALEAFGLCFLFAPRYHPAMKHVAPARAALQIRTLFNLLGPLLNPAKVKQQLLGVFSPKWQHPIAEVLKELGSETAWVVHGSDGLDELTVTGRSHVVQLKGGFITKFDITPEDAGLQRWNAKDLTGGDAAQNAAALKTVLAGETGAYRDAVLLNSAALLLISGSVDDLKEGAKKAALAIDNGTATATLEALINHG